MAVSEAAPALSTPDTHIFEKQVEIPSTIPLRPLSNEQLYVTYEVQRTVSEIRRNNYRRVALQFPDGMLRDAPRVFNALKESLATTCEMSTTDSHELSVHATASDITPQQTSAVDLYILGDTSYGACCVDEIAAEHVNADAVVHYGRACLSPTARIPVIHIFTAQILPSETHLIKVFEKLFEDREQKIILMADVTYQDHLLKLAICLQSCGYSSLFVTNIVHNPSSPLPNRTIPDDVALDLPRLKEWQLFHISDPPESLLLTLSSRVGKMYIYPTSTEVHLDPAKPLLTSTAQPLKRRYALLTSVHAAAVFGILINTLSVKHYMHIVEHVKSEILKAGKKSYTFVVGKVNAAKLANFSEIGAWVVIGCWESSLIDSKDFWKPVLTPFELELALKNDQQRIWSGEWSSDFQAILEKATEEEQNDRAGAAFTIQFENHSEVAQEHDYDSESESAPPEYDLRTGRYVSRSRPMQSFEAVDKGAGSEKGDPNGRALVRRARGDLAIIGGEASPGAEYLQRRMWKGLGSDFEVAYEEGGAPIEEGRSGIARGYRHGDDEGRT